MYNLMVVDDEILMRKYLTANIPKFTDQFQVRGVAKDGLEAIELLKKQHFDLIITDIKMPEINGLALAKYVFENFPETIVIIISGYNEFEYARQALKYQVNDYLLKPLVDNSLIECLESVAQRLSKQQKSDFITTKQPSSFCQKEQLLAAILEEDETQIQELAPDLLAEFTGTVGCISEYTVDELDLTLKYHYGSGVTSDHLKLNQIVRNVAAERGCISIYNTNGATYVFHSADGGKKLHAEIESFYRIVCEKTNAECMPKFTAISGKIVNDFIKLADSYRSIRDIFPLTMLNGKRFIMYSEASERGFFLEKIHSASEQILLDYLSGSEDKMYIAIGEFCRIFEEEKNFSLVLRCGSYLIQYICNHTGINRSYIQKAYSELIALVDEYLHVGIPDHRLVVKILARTIEELNKPGTDINVQSTQGIVSVAKKYILDHYQENLSLSEVAEYCGVSSSYLSDLFHKKLNEPYSKYLLRIRMEQAAKLLKQNPDIHVYTVAEKTGFVSVKHFITVFKKYYGTTPTGYLNEQKSTQR